MAANFSRELADYIIYVIDVAGGDKVPRKGGPGITMSDLLVINKTGKIANPKMTRVLPARSGTVGLLTISYLFAYKITNYYSN